MNSVNFDIRFLMCFS